MRLGTIRPSGGGKAGVGTGRSEGRQAVKIDVVGAGNGSVVDLEETGLEQFVRTATKPSVMDGVVGVGGRFGRMQAGMTRHLGYDHIADVDEDLRTILGERPLHGGHDPGRASAEIVAHDLEASVNAPRPYPDIV